jgi:hypothetical protein
MQMGEDAKNVICIKYGSSRVGSYYQSKHVNFLYNSVVKNTKYKINFYCFTEEAEGLDPNVITKPLPKLNVEKLKYGYLKEAGLCDPDLGGLRGQRVLFFDLDTLIVDNIDCFFELPENRGDDFYIINDWNSFGNRIGQASCYSFTVGSLGNVKECFEQNSEYVYKKFFTAAQEYLSFKVIEKYGKLNFWPDAWARSFKFHCLPTPMIPFLRKFKMAKIPQGAKIICFHGQPKIENAARGVWGEKNAWKRFFYKHLRPVTWISDFLREYGNLL